MRIYVCGPTVYQRIHVGNARPLVVFDLPPDVALRDLGTVVLRDIPRPERLYQVDVPGLPTEFPPPRAGRTTTGNLDVPLTTFVGLLPLVLNKSVQAQFLIPMGVSVAFGSVFATGVSLFLVPTLYLVLEDLRHLVGLGRKRIDAAPVDEPAVTPGA